MGQTNSHFHTSTDIANTRLNLLWANSVKKENMNNGLLQKLDRVVPLVADPFTANSIT